MDNITIFSAVVICSFAAFLWFCDWLAAERRANASEAAMMRVIGGTSPRPMMANPYDVCIKLRDQRMRVLERR